MHKIYLYTQIQSTRLHYIVGFIQYQFENLELVIIHEIPVGVNQVIQYGGTKRVSTFYIAYEGLMELENFPAIEIQYNNNHPVIFSNPECNTGFDIFSALFWMLTFQSEQRVTKTQLDKHQRISVKDHLFFKEKNYKKPILDYWIDQFIQSLNHQFGIGIKRKNSYSYSVGIDVDQAWKFKNKSFVKTYGGLIKSLLKFDLTEFKQRYSVLTNKIKDPFDVFTYLDSFHFSKNQLLYFILNGSPSEFNPNHSIQHPEYKKLLQRLSKKYSIGIHPSYESSDQAKLISKEKSELEELLQKPINQSRQHYLRVNIPETLIQLSQAGITEEFSICFYDETGFRAGTSHPFFSTILHRKKLLHSRYFQLSQWIEPT
ncbi:MAG: hypothetical protein HOP11_11575 [Saprospiraceae bacterium]|nr:hypothetical protein [Saprospiraceae bacterium]